MKLRLLPILLFALVVLTSCDDMNVYQITAPRDTVFVQTPPDTLHCPPHRHRHPH